MQNNYYFLRQLSHEVAQRLRGFTLASCFTQNKDELVMEFNDSRTSFFIRASLTAEFCCLSFPENFSRARKNSLDLFPDLILKKVIGVRQLENERSFCISFEDDQHLLLKMHGNRSNVVLFKGIQAHAIFRNHLKADLALRLDQLDRTIDFSKDFFFAHADDILNFYFTFGKEIRSHLESLGFQQATTEVRWRMISDLLTTLQSPSYFLSEFNDKLTLLLFEAGKIIRDYTSPIEATTDFYHVYLSTGIFLKEKNAAMRQLQTRILNGKAYIKKNESKLIEISTGASYQWMADLIMANMHLIKPVDDHVVVENFYDENKPLKIKLKTNIPAQKNAEIYYRKSKNQQIEIQTLQSSIAVKQAELEKLSSQLDAIGREADLKLLRALISDADLSRPADEKQPELLPYREFEFHGFKIWVGRNAESNDKLTLKYSYKEDLWLHAKDVAGSHVLLKYQSGKNFPKDVIEKAAALAAWFSKRKNESLCPVAFTPKKFVRKRKGDAPGKVVVEREDVILVTPKLI